MKSCSICKVCKANRLTRFLIKCYGAEAVVFDTASGDTHYLSPLAYKLLDTSQRLPGSTYGDIAAALAHQLNTPDNGFGQLIDEARISLQRIGLLESA